MEFFALFALLAFLLPFDRFTKPFARLHAQVEKFLGVVSIRTRAVRLTDENKQWRDRMFTHHAMNANGVRPHDVTGGGRAMKFLRLTLGRLRCI